MLSATRVLGALLAVALALPATGGATPSLPGLLDDECRQIDRVNDACPAWVTTYEHDPGLDPQLPGSPAQQVNATLLSADEERLYVAGRSTGEMGWAILALSPSDGEILWESRPESASERVRHGAPTGVAESPDGGTLYVTGHVWTGPLETELLTVGIDTGTGEVTWEWLWDAPAVPGTATPAHVAVSPDGETVYVAGTSRPDGRNAYAVAAYSFDPERDDPVAWTLDYQARSDRDASLHDLVQAADGSTLYLTGVAVTEGPGGPHATTIAVDAGTGDVTWQGHRRGPDDTEANIWTPSSMALSPTGDRLVVAARFRTSGSTPGPTVVEDRAVTHAYDAAAGEELWVAQSRALLPPGGIAIPHDVLVDDREELVFVAGETSEAGHVAAAISTVALDLDTGEEVWASSYDFPGATRGRGNPTTDRTAALAYDPEIDRVYVAATSGTAPPPGLLTTVNTDPSRIVTLALDAGSGRRVAAMRYGGPDRALEPERHLDLDTAARIALAPDARRLVVTGTFGRWQEASAISGNLRYSFEFGVLGYHLPGGGAALVDAGGWRSQNLEFVTHIPTNNDSAGARILDDTLYITTSQHLKIYDISDPVDPQLLGALALPGQELPYFAEEDPDTNGKILLFGALVVDVSDPTDPHVIGNHGRNSHTISCVLDCTWAYTSGGDVIDLRDPADPKVAGRWTTGMPASSSHDVTEVAPGLVVTSSNPFLLLDAREDPANPTLLAQGPQEPGRFNHGNLWPNGATDRFLLMGGESGTTTDCSSNPSARLRTFDVSSWMEDGTIEETGSYTVSGGLYTSGDSPADLFCAHWFDTHPTYRDGGLVAMAWYEHGTRLLRITPEGKIREIGYYIPFGGSTSAAYWVTDDIVYSVDYNRGLDILRYTGRP